MQRLAVSLSAFALIVVMVLNVALFAQNMRLRQQLATNTAQPQPAEALPNPTQAATRLPALIASASRRAWSMPMPTGRISSRVSREKHSRP